MEDIVSGRKTYTPTMAAIDVEAIFRLLAARWKLLILFRLFGGQVQRFSDLERSIPGISQKMLAQQLHQLEDDGIVTRTVYQQVPPKVDYRLTEWGQKLCPALDALLKWFECRDDSASAASSPRVTAASLARHGARFLRRVEESRGVAVGKGEGPASPFPVPRTSRSQPLLEQGPRQGVTPSSTHSPAFARSY